MVLQEIVLDVMERLVKMEAKEMVVQVMGVLEEMVVEMQIYVVVEPVVVAVSIPMVVLMDIGQVRLMDMVT